MIFVMNNNVDWLTKRLKEIGHTKLELASVIGKPSSRLSELIKKEWDVPTNKIKIMADFLQFDRLAFLDFLSGDITEEQLWNTKPEIITESDRQLLQAFKTMATAQASNNQNQNIPEQTNNER